MNQGYLTYGYQQVQPVISENFNEIDNMNRMETVTVLLRGAWEGAAAQEWFAGSSCSHKDGGTLDFGSFVAIRVQQSRHKGCAWQLPAAQKILPGYPNIKK